MIAYDPICIRSYNGTIHETNSYLITHEQGRTRWFKDANGNETMLARVYLDKMDVKSGSAREYTMSELTSLVNESNYQKQMKSGKDYTVRVDVTVSTGEILTVAEVEISK